MQVERRLKRDLAKDGYNWLMKMMPQSIREPLHHSIQAAHPESESLRQKIEKLIKFKRVEEPPSKPNIFKKKSTKTPYKDLMNHYDLLPHTIFGIPKLSHRSDQTPAIKADESSLLRKLKRLNNNPFCSDLEEQATSFVKGLLQPNKAPKRKKRSIILGSDELDLPPHYKVDMVSDEDGYVTSKEDEEGNEEEDEEESPIVSGRRFLAPPISPRQLLASFNRLQPKAEVVMGKNMIQKAVRDELVAYHKKIEREQKLKNVKPAIPQNPIFLLLTAPMQFLRHFSDLNKGANPMLSTLPKMVFTAKKYFKDFGKNFHRHCLNLASDIIGDFDHVQPNVIEKIGEVRHRRDVTGGFCEGANVEEQNFREVLDDHVRKKRYVVKVVDDDEVQEELEDYLTEKMDDRFSYLKPLQEYYDKVSDLFSKLRSVQPSHLRKESQNSEEEVLEKPQRKKIVVQKLKPRIIIDNNGWPFMEYDGFKRPLLLNRLKHHGLTGKVSVKSEEKSSEEEGERRIAAIIAKAKENSEVVGNAPKDIMPRQLIKERIHSLLEEIDRLVDLNAEDYDNIFESLIKVHQVKSSVEQDWKRLLINNKIEDLNTKIGLLIKFKDLQKIKDEGVKIIIEKLQENDNEFVRRQLVHSLIRLQKLQCLISKFVEDFDQNLQMKTSFSTKKEIKYIDYLSELKFVYASTKTRNDLVKKLCQDRDAEGQRNIELLNKLKKLLVTPEVDSEKFDSAAKLIWEMKNLKKLQGETIKDMNKKLQKHQKIKKELKILFDLQKRFEDCGMELNEVMGSNKAANKLPVKKDVRDVVTQIRRRHEEVMQRAKEKAGGLRIRY
ncbi:putative leucine-rich repeat-containing protein DDB_G0290503 [Euwallacea fornicatus]|uniref:putative leucine-rich repeat-containing protein DDB_G0290503 n=1 Tax=Euwallacea fornicatus TaxID=995702 RepID=UPI00338E1307